MVILLLQLAAPRWPMVNGNFVSATACLTAKKPAAATVRVGIWVSGFGFLVSCFWFFSQLSTVKGQRVVGFGFLVFCQQSTINGQLVLGFWFFCQQSTINGQLVLGFWFSVNNQLSTVNWFLVFQSTINGQPSTCFELIKGYLECSTAKSLVV